MQRRFALKAISAAIAASGLVSLPALAADTIKVGILHSLSGTMAISETVLKDVALMTIDEINAKGGVLGKKIEPIVEDPESKFTTVFPETDLGTQLAMAATWVGLYLGRLRCVDSSSAESASYVGSTSP